MNQIADEIKAKLTTAKGEDRVKLLNELAREVYSTNPEQAETYAREGIELAIQIDCKIGEAQCYQTLGITYWVRGESAQAIENTIKATEIFEAIKNEKGMAGCYGNLGLFYWRQGDYNLALSYQKKALAGFEKLQDQQGIANSYSNMGLIYMDQNQNELSLECFLSSLKIDETLDNKSNIGKAYVNISAIYQQQGDHESAMKYLKQAIKNLEESNDLYHLAAAHINLGIIYNKHYQDSQIALEYFLRAKTYYEQVGDKHNLAIVNSNIAAIYEDAANYQKALIYRLQSLQVFEEIESKYDISLCCSAIGYNYIYLEQFDKACDYLMKAQRISQEIEALDIQKNTYYNLCLLYEKQGKFEEALAYHKKYTGLGYEILNEERIHQIAEMQTKYDTELYRLKNVELVEKNNLILQQKEEIEIQREELQIQNEQLTETLDQLQQTQEQLIESRKMMALSDLVMGVAHEINTPVGVAITASSALTSRTQQFFHLYEQDHATFEDLEEYIKLMQELGKLIHENLDRIGGLVQSFKQVSIDQSNEKKRRFNLKLYLQDVLNSLQPHLKEKNIESKLICPAYIETISYPGIFAQIITTLVQNSLVHGFDGLEEGQIKIDVTNKDKKIVLQYRDNGVGIPADLCRRIFDPFFTINKQKGIGLGLHIIYNLITQKLKGSIGCKSDEGEGVLFEIRVDTAACV